MDVVATAFARSGPVAAEAPDAVDALNAVEQPGPLKSRQGPIERDPVEAADLRLTGDLLVGERSVRPKEHLQHSPSCPRATHARCM
jgi:hypothetical protein